MLWDPGVVALNVPIGPSSTANSINDKKQIVGWMGVAPFAPYVSYPFLWENGTCTQLSLPANAQAGVATSINNAGSICGYYRIADVRRTGYRFRAVVWKNGEMIELGVLPGFTSSYTTSINDAGDVIGSCAGNGNAYYLWRSGTMYRIDQLITPNVGLSDFGIRSIDSSGVIVGHANLHTKGLVLTPIAAVIGDVNCDQVVNVIDLLAVIGAWGGLPFQGGGNGGDGSGSPDLNGDGMVDVNDLLMVINHWS